MPGRPCRPRLPGGRVGEAAAPMLGSCNLDQSTLGPTSRCAASGQSLRVCLYGIRLVDYQCSRCQSKIIHLWKQMYSSTYTTSSIAAHLSHLSNLHPPWRNWLSRPTVNRETPGSIPGGGVFFPLFFASKILFLFLFFYF